MSIFASPRFLRHVLVADAASCLGSGALQLAFTTSLAGLLRLPAPLVVGTGLFLVAYGALVGLVATRDPVPRALVALFAIGNIGWAAACIALLAGGWLSPSGLGQAWVLAQAACVAVLAGLQGLSLYALSSSPKVSFP